MSRQLNIDDILRIKTLMPDFIVFEYIGKDEFDEVNQENISPSEALHAPNTSKNSEYSPVLHFRFTDYEINARKTQKSQKLGYGFLFQSYLSLRFCGNSDIPSTFAMTNLIQRRNQRFRNAVADYIHACNEDVSPHYRFLIFPRE